MDIPSRALCVFMVIFGVFPTHLAFAADSLPTSTADPTTSPSLSEDTSPPETTTPVSLLKNFLSIKSINPGFKIDNVAETGEAIELENSGEISLPLDKVSLRYRNSDGKSYELYAFPDGSAAIGKIILFRYDKSPEIKAAIAATGDSATVADATYAKTLALTGSFEIVYSADTPDEVIIDSVCWGKSSCPVKKFDSNNPGSLVRESALFPTTPASDPKTSPFTFSADYSPTYDPANPGLYLPKVVDPASEDAETPKSPQCLDLEFSEILAYYADDPADQFLEIYNPTDEKISLVGCVLRYKNKNYDFATTNISSENDSNSSVSPSEFYVYRPKSLRFTKNPNKENTLEIIDVTDESIAKLSYPHGQKKGTAYALISGAWKKTYAPTPGATNIDQEFRTCPLGKVINEKTGNCVKVATVASVKPCPAGKYRNPETGRCKSSAKSKTAKPCKEGYERNPETNRCRKIRKNDGSDYALVPITGDPEKSSFVALGALALLVIAGLAYTAFQFRKELLYFPRKLLANFKKR